ncbi:MAG: hypothetical protein ACTTKO_08410 [Candidatus Limimorpha sp.]
MPTTKAMWRSDRWRAVSLWAWGMALMLAFVWRPLSRQTVTANPSDQDKKEPTANQRVYLAESEWRSSCAFHEVRKRRKMVLPIVKCSPRAY